MLRTQHDAMPAPAQQEPLRNTSYAGVHVLAHSGEFAPQVTDLSAPGRGENSAFTRRCRSALFGHPMALGYGWSWTYDKRLAAAPDGGIVYDDGVGCRHRFAAAGDGRYVSPDGCYAQFAEDGAGAGPELRLRYGDTLHFFPPADGGRLRRVVNATGDTREFAYAPDQVTVTDSLGVVFTAVLDHDLITELHDPWGRTWRYANDDRDCLIEVRRPAAEGFPQGTTIRYDYDAERRLKAVTNPAGETFLRNRYGSAGRVVEQRHGAGPSWPPRSG
jgi:YD repeat-containing protein